MAYRIWTILALSLIQLEKIQPKKYISSPKNRSVGTEINHEQDLRHNIHKKVGIFMISNIRQFLDRKWENTWMNKL